MKIDDISLTMFRWDDIPEVIYGPNVRQPAGTNTLALLEMKTDDGVVGHSFLGASGPGAEVDADLLLKHLKPAVMGKDPRDRELHHRVLHGRARAASVRAIGALDVAIHDICGKLANMPIHQLLGSFRRSIAAYASSPMHLSIGAYCDEALFWKERGLKAYKLHITGDVKTDIEICTAVRRAVGDDHVLMLDAGFSYDYPQALRVGRAIEELGFLWYEDPLGQWSIPNYIKLKQKLDVPIMATELPFAGFDMYAPWLLNQATDYLRGDVAFKGGIITMVKTAHLAEAFDMNYEIHHGSNSANNIANLHVMMAIKNCEYYEYLLPEAIVNYGLVNEPIPDKDGLLHAPMKPGLGADIDFDLIEHKKIAVLR
jgi:L-alanine-DL-glutamate epimerase-like enolase superfamily enzyme